MTSIVVTTLAQTSLSQCLDDLGMDMGADLRHHYGRVKVDCRENTEKRKEADLTSQRNEGERRWSWGMWSMSWQVVIEDPVRVA